MEPNRLLGAVSDYLSSLSPRERRIVLAGLPLLLLALYVLVVLVPILSAKEAYHKKELLLREKLQKLMPQVRELVELKSRLELVLERVERGKELSPVSYVRSVARMVGLEVSKVKLLQSRSQGGIEVELLSLKFKEQPLNRVSRLISKLERGKYYFKSDSIKISDYDENGLVSGEVTLYFFRGEK